MAFGFMDIDAIEAQMLIDEGVTVYVTDRLTLITYNCSNMPEAKLDEAIADKTERYNFYVREEVANDL